MKVEQLQALQPQVFDRLVATLAQGKLSHAYLFIGALGSYDMALMLSQALFCEQPQNSLPCQSCRSCRLIAEGGFTDVTVVEPQGNLIKTETIRDLVKQFSQSGFESTKQVFIIRDAEKMHANAANALLKSMEEPDSDLVLFLLSNQEEAVLPTIKSRAQLVYFPANVAYVQEQLERKGLLTSQARLIAQLAESLEMAEELAGQASFLELMQVSQRFVESWIKQPKQAYLLVPGLVAKVAEKAEQERLLSLLTVQAAAYLTESLGGKLLEGLLVAKQMLTSNVTLQNALEHLVLQRMN